MDATSGAGTTYPSGASDFTPGFCCVFFFEGVQVAQTLIF